MQLTRRWRQVVAATLLGLLLPTTTVLAQESDVEVAGELDVLILEDFDHGHEEMAYFVRKSGSKQAFELKFRQPPGQLRSGQQVRIKGRAHGRKVWVDTLSTEGSTSSSTGGQSAAGDATLMDARRTVVLMVDLSNVKASTRYTLAQIAGQMYTNSQSVDGLYRKASLNQMSFPADTDGNGQPDVFGPFTINYDNSTCDYYGWAYAAEAAATAAGVNLSLYRHRVFVLPRYNDLPQCRWAGVANVGCGTFCRAWIAEGESGMVYAHELGHNLGMAHAGTDPENDGVINSTYGDYSDPMGSSRSWLMLNAGHIDQMGWYAGIPGAITTVTANGTYDLLAIGNEPMVSGAPTALKIAKPDSGDFYYLSYRQPIGTYNQLSSTYTQGVNIHRYKGSSYNYTSFIKSLADGVSFTDSVNGITITQVSHNSSHVTVNISMGNTCISMAPTVNINPLSKTVRRGTAVSFTATVGNQDNAYCNQTTFSLSYAGTPTGTLSSNSLTLSSGQTSSVTLQVTTTGLADGAYALPVSVSDNDGNNPSHSPVTGSRNHRFPDRREEMA